MGEEHAQIPSHGIAGMSFPTSVPQTSPTASSLAMMSEEQNPRDFWLQEIPPPSPYLGDREQNPNSSGSEEQSLSPPHQFPAGRLGCGLPQDFSPSWPLLWPAGWEFTATRVPRSCG